MMDRYDYFFKSIKDFIISLDLANEKKEHKLEEKDLDFFGTFKGKEINQLVKVYLKYFGTQVAFKNNGLGNSLFNLASISNAEDIAEAKNLKSKIHKIKIVDGWEEREIDFENKELLFLKYDVTSSSCFFVINSNENSILYIYWEGGEVTSDNINFITYIRDTVFWELMRIVKSTSEKENSKVFKIEWMKFYEFLRNNHLNIRNKIISWRYEFNYSFEESGKSLPILDIDEYEIKFITFLLEEKKLDFDLSKFDPYSFDETYRTYLL